MNSMQNAMEVIAADTGKCAVEFHQRLNRVYVYIISYVYIYPSVYRNAGVLGQNDRN